MSIPNLTNHPSCFFEMSFLAQPEHIPVFKALLESTDLHQKGDSVHAKMGTASTLKIHARGDNTQTDKRTSRLLDQISQMGRFGENLSYKNRKI